MYFTPILSFPLSTKKNSEKSRPQADSAPVFRAFSCSPQRWAYLCRFSLLLLFLLRYTNFCCEKESLHSPRREFFLKLQKNRLIVAKKPRRPQTFPKRERPQTVRLFRF
ncbi:MAG: hypothetical protein J6E31_09130 [Pyramidobacter sp.]|nr:hypothetical protein [Pyramidobacter sp.]